MNFGSACSSACSGHDHGTHIFFCGSPCRELPRPTTDDIEVFICGDEDTAIKLNAADHNHMHACTCMMHDIVHI